MPGMSISISGDKELQQKLHRLAGSMPHAIEEAVLSAATVYRDGMKRRVRKRSRRTEEDIQIHDQKVTASGFSAKAGPTSGKGGRAYIARFLEYGTSKMQAYPFVRPTLDEDTPEAIRMAGKEIDAAIKEAGL